MNIFLKYLNSIIKNIVKILFIYFLDIVILFYIKVEYFFFKISNDFKKSLIVNVKSKNYYFLILKSENVKRLCANQVRFYCSSYTIIQLCAQPPFYSHSPSHLQIPASMKPVLGIKERSFGKETRRIGWIVMIHMRVCSF